LEKDMPDSNPDQAMLAGVTLTLNPPFVEQCGESGVRSYCHAVAEVARCATELPPSELSTMLRARLDQLAIVLPEISYDRTAEQLSEGAGGPLSVVLTDGTVLYGPGPHPIPEVHPGDPDHPERPTYS
jgi:hypothetical protein